MTLEVYWKYMKYGLEDCGQMQLESTSPRSIIMKAAAVRILKEEQALFLLELLNLRNQTSHIYKEEVAVSIVTFLSRHYRRLEEIIIHCKPSCF